MTQPYSFTHTADTTHAKASAAKRLRSNGLLGMNRSSGYMENPLRQNFFRAGHAHAGMIVILSLVCQILADAAVLPAPMLWFIRIGVPVSAILISAGFFFSVLPRDATRVSGAVSLIYAGALLLAIGVVTLGVGLLRTPRVG